MLMNRILKSTAARCSAFSRLVFTENIHQLAVPGLNSKTAVPCSSSSSFHAPHSLVTRRNMGIFFTSKANDNEFEVGADLDEFADIAESSAAEPYPFWRKEALKKKDKRQRRNNRARGRRSFDKVMSMVQLIQFKRKYKYSHQAMRPVRVERSEITPESLGELDEKTQKIMVGPEFRDVLSTYEERQARREKEKWDARFKYMEEVQQKMKKKI